LRIKEQETHLTLLVLYDDDDDDDVPLQTALTLSKSYVLLQTAIIMNYFVFWVITRCEVLLNDVSVLPTGPIFKGHDVRERGHLDPSRWDGYSSETSVSNPLTSGNNLKNDRI
jgi:hypothetical protein